MVRLLKDKLPEWILDLTFGKEIEGTNSNIEQLAARLFDQYEPTSGPHEKFRQRLDAWLNNLPDEADQKLLFRLVPYLFFLGPRELEILYRVALNAHIDRWLIEQNGLMLDSPFAAAKLVDFRRRCWFCPITDSMRINAFYHLNNISGTNYRPDWLSLAKFGDRKAIAKFVHDRGIERIVLLEDFVGSGDQISPAIQFAATLEPKVPLLIVPLILCPEGTKTLSIFTKAFAHVSFSSVLQLSPNDFLSKRSSPDEPSLFDEIRPLVERQYPRLLKGLTSDDRAKMYGPYGFQKTGGLIVMWTNCPDNTLPAIHCKSREWQPLFPRASRL